MKLWVCMLFACGNYKDKTAIGQSSPAMKLLMYYTSLAGSLRNTQPAQTH